MMRFKRNGIAVFIALAVLAAGGAAWAAGTTTVAVTATVAGTCKFSNTGSISFTLDPSIGTDQAGTITQPKFWCTKNLAYTITDDKGLHKSGTIFRMQHATDITAFIPYSFTYTATGTGAGAGPTNQITMNIASSVLGTDYVNATQGNYADTVTLSITP